MGLAGCTVISADRLTPPGENAADDAAIGGKTMEMGQIDIRALRLAFEEPPVRYWPRPLWFWNDTLVTRPSVEEQMEKAFNLCGYGGFGLLPFGKGFAPAYLSDSYFEIYSAVLDKARQLGMTLSLYDEYGFPSGAAGAPNSSDISLFSQRYPDRTIKRLDNIEFDVTGPLEYKTEMPAGFLCAVVAMNTTSLERIDLTATVRDAVCFGRFRGTMESDGVCLRTGRRAVLRLSRPRSGRLFIQITQQTYYNRFPDHFGTTIDSTFHDEPTLYRAKGRSWTNRFNEKFQAHYGFDPRPYYPALWYDIGPETEAARNYLFGFRAHLYATGFMKRIKEWSASHGIIATGHQDQEEIVNPVSVSGDLMKCFKYQQVPGIDKIGGDRPAERFYKVISSAAYNWDKDLVMSETYGAMGNLSWDQIYAVAMEQYTKGINMLIPHAVWYDDSNVTFKPDLSWRNPLYADHLRQFNQYLSRLNVMLQNDAAHVADIAVLYPIATCQAGHTFDGPLGYYRGGVEIPEADYIEVGEQLIGLGYDYTFLHPEVFEEKCRIQKDRIVLPNKIHLGRFQILILPGHKTISWSSLRKIQAFFEQGGFVIATGCLPSKSAEFGHDQDVQKPLRRYSVLTKIRPMR